MRLARLVLKNYVGIYNGMGLSKIDIDFSRCKNRILVIKGDNGTGKSTMYKAMNPMNDNTIEFIPGLEASKIISYFLDDGSTLTISYVSPVSSSGDRKPSQCSILRTFPNQSPVELNPARNITTAKSIIYELFDLDDNFIMLSQLSANQKGLGGLKPADRKKYVNAIIDSLSAYMDMYKTLSKKGTILKSMIGSLSTKLSQIGNIEMITDQTAKLQQELDQLEKQKEQLVSVVATIKAQLDEINKDGDILQQFTTANNDLMFLKDEYSKLPPLDSIEYSDDNLIQLEKELSSLEAKVESDESRLQEYVEKETKIRNEINSIQIELDSLEDQALISDIDSRIKMLSNQMKEYVSSFESLGFSAYNDITEQEYLVAVEALEKINNSIYILADKYSQTDRETALQYLNKPLVEDVDSEALITSLQQKVIELTDSIKEQYRIKDASKAYDDIPKDCNHFDDCPLTHSIRESRKGMVSKEVLESMEAKRDDLISSINDLKIKSEKFKITLSAVNEVKFLVQYIESMYKIISKFPNTSSLSSIKNISHHILNTVPININIEKYKEYSNYISLISGLNDDILSLKERKKKIESSSKTSMMLRSNLDRFHKDLDEILSSKLGLVGKITTLKERYLKIKAMVQSIRTAKALKERYDEISTKLQSTTTLVDKLSSSTIRARELAEKYTEEKTKLNRISMQDIPTLSNQIEQNKYRMVMFDQYKKDYTEYEKMYTTLQSLRHYTSINGIQTVYMTMFMNSILQSTNNLLQLLFSGRFVLQPFIINENEFRIPCIDIEGNLRPDISMMSDSQLSMISMLISFTLLHKASETYNIIKLDEVDNNLDNENRLQFSLLINSVMDILNFHQCIIISHNNEIDLSSADMILLKIENQETLAYLNTSGANIIYSYNE